MKKLAYFFIILLIFNIIFTSSVFSDSSKDNTKAFNNKSYLLMDELGKFKELIDKIMPDIKGNSNAGISSDEIDVLIKEIFDEESFDKPITIDNWAKLVKIIVKLPKGDMDKLIKMYVYGLADGNQIHREDAIGGLVKLLSNDYLRMDLDANEFKKFKLSLKDGKDISDKQDILVFAAYKGEILDKTVDKMFRPKDLLTNAEAASTLYRVATKLTMNPNFKNNWVLGEISNYEKIQKKKLETVEFIREFIEEESFDKPIYVKEWYTIVEELLSIKDLKSKRNIKNYTFDLSDGRYITRENAVVGIMKLVPDDPRDATEEELSRSEKHFKDFEDIDNTSKVAQAFVQGLIKGYEDKTFRPKENITYGEAAALIIRVMEKNDFE